MGSCLRPFLALILGLVPTKATSGRALHCPHAGASTVLCGSWPGSLVAQYIYRGANRARNTASQHPPSDSEDIQIERVIADTYELSVHSSEHWVGCYCTYA